MSFFKSFASFCKMCTEAFKSSNKSNEQSNSTAVTEAANSDNIEHVTVVEENDKTEKDLAPVEYYEPIKLTVTQSKYEFAHGSKFKNPPKWIVVHYTACAGVGAASMCKSMSRNTGASSHFFVDSKSIYASVPLKYVAWHVAGGQCSQPDKDHPKTLEELSNYKAKDWRFDLAAKNHIEWKSKKDDFLGNYYSIGIDICVLKKSDKSKKSTDTDWYFNPKAVENLAMMVAYLAKEYKIDLDHIIRHADATGKLCPQPFAWPAEQGDANWSDFKNKVAEYMKHDITVKYVKES